MKRASTKRITHNDKAILDFLNGTAMMDKVPSSNSETMAKALSRRIKIHKLEGLKARLLEGTCYLQVDDPSFKTKNLEIYHQVEEARKKMKEDTKLRIKEYLRTHKRPPSSRRIDHMSDSISDTVDKVCYDFSETDKEFLKSEITKKLTTIKTKGRSYHIQTAAMVYLLSKCPANSEKPLQFKEVFSRYCSVDGHAGITAFYDAISFVKENGVQSCRITCEMVINSKKDALMKFAENSKIPQTDMEGVIANAIDLSRKNKLAMQGKNPFVVSATDIYYSRGKCNAITQRMLSEIFHVTEVSIRNTINRYVELGIPML
jgi:transcription initiation factor TFIIIB Brf1 subunit/transcription initiation factor TFIIB